LALRCALAGVLLAAAGSLAVKAGLPLPPAGLVVWFALVAAGVVLMYRRVRESRSELTA
jgi:heme A synthase